MNSFAPAYQHDDTSARFGNLTEYNCKDYGRDSDDDLADDYDYECDEADASAKANKYQTSNHSGDKNDSKRIPGSVARGIARSKRFSAYPAHLPTSDEHEEPSTVSHGSPQMRAYRYLGRQPSKRSLGVPQRRDERSATRSPTLASPTSAFMTSPSIAPRTSSLARSPGAQAPSLSRRMQPEGLPEPVQPVRPEQAALSSGDKSRQRYEPPVSRSPQAAHKVLSRSTLSSTTSDTSEIPTFAQHPAVRPLESRAALGNAAGPAADDDSQYPSALPLVLIVTGVCLAVFIISLNRNIIITAIPDITSRFHSYNDIGWYGSAYLLTASAFQPLYGRIYMSFSTKSSFIVTLVVFEVGSLICALAPSSDVLIVGRAVQGVGSAGILTGAFVVVTHIVRLQTRPIVFAGVGILYAVGALCGPLIGGAFTDTIGWRWCFWINLPCGLVTLVAVSLFFRPSKPSTSKPSFVKRVLSLDLVGNLLVLGAAVQLFTALQLSEERLAWSSAPVIGLMCGFGATTLIFVGWIIYKGDAALLPPAIVTQRTVAASCGAAFFIYGTILLHSYYLPIYFQAIKASSALGSGVNMIPYMLANAVLSMLAGIFVSKRGLFAPPAIIGCAIGTVGCGLLATLDANTPTARWIGYEILASAGIGMAIQQGFSAVQTALPLELVPIGTAAVVACQSAGGAIFISVGNTLLQNHLVAGDNRIAGVNIRAVIELGTTQFRQHVPESALPALVDLYSRALQGVFIAAVPLCGCAFLSSLFMEWRSVRAAEEQTKAAAGQTKRRTREVEEEKV
ncbi:uncharacterized protein HMPREF1541_09103 [Cyphellophora europaea CBS 101466]|uniref:Major facilitator superfamily (MFS) profile domain-containing protein n=1 Tax=Cyphellophora europaea (strain CBS 101466) TaxID=1220924 RepID=W2S9C5_CYPE1|nr:uncharacterized protein HMPREF1541_09103 [Cyphellophora europaea CBS 101466]ETN45272.1 hypothetical protein HMPREF1541_09103 [Cyphellophora europaea CBS 101466]